MAGNRRGRLSTLMAGGLVLCAAGAMSVDDGRFWLRWLARVPAMVGLAPAAKANAVPELRATIPAPLPRQIRRCQADKALTQAGAAARRYLDDGKTDAFVVWHNGCIVAETYFSGNAATPRAAGAMAKSLEAIAVGRAIREGVIPGLDAPVAATVAEWRGDERAKIRWRDLLSMHAGLQWYRQQSSPFSDFQRIIIGSDYAPRALGLKAIAPPDSVFDYSAWTYDVLGLALARAGGASYETLASRWLSAPLGLHPMSIYVDRPGGSVHANCCLWSRADDWIALGALLVDEARQPRLLPTGFVGEMRRSRPDQPNYGLGVWLGTPYRPERRIASPRNPYPTPVKSVIRQSAPFLADDVMIFEGVGQTKTWVIPSRKLVIVRFGTAPKTWDDAVVPNLFLQALQP